MPKSWVRDSWQAYRAGGFSAPAPPKHTPPPRDSYDGLAPRR